MSVIAGQTTLRVSTATEQTAGATGHGLRLSIVGTQACISNLASPNGNDIASSNQTFDANAGSTVTISAEFQVPAGAPTTGNLVASYGIKDDAGNVIVAKTAIITLAGGFAGTAQYTGTATWTPAKCGTYELVGYLDYAQTTTDGVSGGYTSDSTGTYNRTGTPNLWNSTLRGADRGYLRINTTATTTFTAGTHAYGDSLVATTTLGVAPVVSKTVTVATAHNGATASGASTTTTFTTTLHSVDNTYPASSGTETSTTAFPNSAFSGVAWMSPTTKTEGSATVDPRLTYTHEMQFNDNTFGTPPSAKDSGGTQRLSSNLAFLDARVTNANGVGVNSITWTTSLQDVNHLANSGSPYTRSVTSANEGGQDGWGSSFLGWSDVLPTGNWTKTNTITAPAGAVGLDTNASVTYQLVASNPNYRIICAGGPATVATDARHFTPGDSFLVGIAVINVETMTMMALDSSPAPAVAIGRFNLTLGRAEFLASDGTTWNAASGGTVYFHPCTVSPGDANAYTKTFTGTQTSGWGNADVFIVGSAFIGGVPVNDFYKEIVVNGVNNHDAYKFDGGGFVGFPQK